MSNARDMLHVGQISAINTNTATASAAFDDLDGHVSGDMQMIFPAMGKWRAFWIPKPGDHATVLRLPNGSQEGFILGTHYTASNMPQGGAEGLVALISEDGANKIILDAVSGCVTSQLKDSATIRGKNVCIEANEIKLFGNVSINGGLTVTGDITNTGNMQTGGVHTDSRGTHEP